MLEEKIIFLNSQTLRLQYIRTSWRAQSRIDSQEKLAGADLAKTSIEQGLNREERLLRQRQNDAVKGAEIGRKIAEQITKGS